MNQYGSLDKDNLLNMSDRFVTIMLIIEQKT